MGKILGNINRIEIPLVGAKLDQREGSNCKFEVTRVFGKGASITLDEFERQVGKNKCYTKIPDGRDYTITGKGPEARITFNNNVEIKVLVPAIYVPDLQGIWADMDYECGTEIPMINIGINGNISVGYNPHPRLGNPENFPPSVERIADDLGERIRKIMIRSTIETDWTLPELPEETKKIYEEYLRIIYPNGPLFYKC